MFIIFNTDVPLNLNTTLPQTLPQPNTVALYFSKKTVTPLTSSLQQCPTVFKKQPCKTDPKIVDPNDHQRISPGNECSPPEPGKTWKSISRRMPYTRILPAIMRLAAAAVYKVIKLRRQGQSAEIVDKPPNGRYGKGAMEHAHCCGAAQSVRVGSRVGGEKVARALKSRR